LQLHEQRIVVWYAITVGSFSTSDIYGVCDLYEQLTAPESMSSL